MLNQERCIMKKGSLFALLLCAMLICLVGCNDNVASNLGTLEIEINAGESRGIEPLSMETKAYNVTVSNSQGEVVFSSSNSTKTRYTASVPVGPCNILVEALNGDGEVIGQGSASGDVVANEINRITVVVEELSGSGTFSISIRGKEGQTLSYTVKDASFSVVSQGRLQYSLGKYSLSEELPVGFYTFSIVWEEANEVVKTDAIRVVSGKTVVYDAEFLFLSEGSVSIVNEILGTPTITLTSSAKKLSPEGVLKVSARISGIENYTSFWMVDGVPVTEEGEYENLELSMENYSDGYHAVSLFVRSGNIIWSEKTVFELRNNYAERHFVGSRSYSNYWYFFDFADGEVKYSYYEGSFVEYEPVPYSVKEDENGVYYIFKENRRTYDYALFVPNDSQSYALLYYQYGFDENGNSVDNYVGISLEETRSAVVWEDAGYDIYDKNYHVGLLCSEYATIRSSNREAHSYDENGICSACGYDGHHFDILDDVSHVSEGPGRIQLCRYWPGEFELSDGTTVNTSDKFYVKRIVSNNNLYNLYYPATIYDVYEESGGAGDIDSAFSWYLGLYYPEFGYNISEMKYRDYEDIKTVLEALLSLDYVEPAPGDDDITINRTVVKTDPSEFGNEITAWGLYGKFNSNTFMLDDGTPATEDRIYFKEKRDGYIAVYYPMVLCEMYEKSYGVNSTSGDPFWSYLSIYYPNLNRSSDNAKEVIEVLSGDFIEPKLEDYIRYFGNRGR